MRQDRLWGQLKELAVTPDKMQNYTNQHLRCINDLVSVSPSRTSIGELIIRKSLFDSGIVGPVPVYPGAITVSVWLICL